MRLRNQMFPSSLPRNQLWQMSQSIAVEDTVALLVNTALSCSGLESDVEAVRNVNSTARFAEHRPASPTRAPDSIWGATPPIKEAKAEDATKENGNRLQLPPHEPLSASLSLAGTALQVFMPFAARPITLMVGTPAISFMAHQNVLIEVSSFFRAALRQPTITCRSSYTFAEAVTGVVHLPEDRPEDVAYFLRWAYWHSLAELVNPLPDEQSGGQLALYHDLIDVPIRRYAKWRTGKLLIKQTFGGGSNEFRAFRKRRHRPRPPAFGPLVRLYIFADHYCVTGGLKDDICRKVAQVGSAANCVPDADDVDMLWENVLESDKQGLKRVILTMFAKLDEKSMRSVLADQSGVDEGKWHSGFLRDLVLRSMSTEH